MSSLLAAFVIWWCIIAIAGVATLMVCRRDEQDAPGELSEVA